MFGLKVGDITWCATHSFEEFDTSVNGSEGERRVGKSPIRDQRRCYGTSTSCVQNQPKTKHLYAVNIAAFAALKQTVLLYFLHHKIIKPSDIWKKASHGVSLL